MPGDRVRPQIFTSAKFGEKRALISQGLQNSPGTAHIRPVQRKQACMCRLGTGAGNTSPRRPIRAASMLLPAVKREQKDRAGSFRWEDVDGKEGAEPSGNQVASHERRYTMTAKEPEAVAQ